MPHEDPVGGVRAQVGEGRDQVLAVVSGQPDHEGGEGLGVVPGRQGQAELLQGLAGAGVEGEELGALGQEPAHDV